MPQMGKGGRVPHMEKPWPLKPTSETDEQACARDETGLQRPHRVPARAPVSPRLGYWADQHALAKSLIIMSIFGE